MSYGRENKIPHIVQQYFRDMLEMVDSELGDGEARKNLPLVASLVQSCATIHAGTPD